VRADWSAVKGVQNAIAGNRRSARVRDGRPRTNIGNVSTLDAAVVAFNPLCACPIPNASRLAPQAR
jgi:hypothetical protein